MRRYILLLMVLFFFAGCDNDINTPLESEDSNKLPLNIVFTDNNKGAVYFNYNNETKKYENFDFLVTFPRANVVRIGDIDYFWDKKRYGIKTNNEITSFSLENRSFLSTVIFDEPIQDLASYNNYIYVCVENSLIVLDHNLKEVSNLSLEFEGVKKNAHDIIIYDDVAYLLDNIMYPIYVLKVDVKEPSELKIIEKVKIDGINQHLSHHWLDLESEKWLIRQEESTRTGDFSSIYSLEMYKKNNKVKEIDYSDIANNIITSTPISPIWALTYSSDDVNSIRLVKINYKQNNLLVESYFDLYENETYQFENDDVMLKEKNGFIFIVSNLEYGEYSKQGDWSKSETSSRLTIVNTNLDYPKIIYDEDLEVTLINDDFFPYLVNDFFVY